MCSASNAPVASTSTAIPDANTARVASRSSANMRGAISGLMAVVVEDHIRTHLVDPGRNPDALNAAAAEQLIDVVHTYLK